MVIFDKKTMLSLKSSHTKRFYEHLLNYQEPSTISIDDLEILLGVEGKSSCINDFLKKIIDPIKTELDEKSIISFTYSKGYEGETVVSITIFPYYTS